MSKLLPISKLQDDLLRLQEVEETSLESVFSNVSVAKILLIIGGREYVVDIENMLSFGKDITDVSDIELDGSLEKISSWLHTLISAVVEVKKLKKKQHRILERWKAKKIREFRLRNFEKDPNDTRCLREALLDDNNNKEYEELMDEIDEFDAMAEKMEKLYEILSKRNDTLRTLLVNRRETKGGRGREYSI